MKQHVASMLIMGSVVAFAGVALLVFWFYQRQVSAQGLYQDNEYGFEVMYPAGWRIEVDGFENEKPREEDRLVRFRKPPYNLYSPSIDILVENDNTPLGDYVRGIDFPGGKLGEINPDGLITSRSEAHVGSIKGERITYFDGEGGEITRIIFPVGKNLIIFRYLESANPAFESIVQSFRVSSD